jgi:hypothetical protein
MLGCNAVGLRIENQIYPALPIEVYILAPVASHMLESQFPGPSSKLIPCLLINRKFEKVHAIELRRGREQRVPTCLVLH